MRMENWKIHKTKNVGVVDNNVICTTFPTELKQMNKKNLRFAVQNE